MRIWQKSSITVNGFQIQCLDFYSHDIVSNDRTSKDSYSNLKLCHFHHMTVIWKDYYDDSLRNFIEIQKIDKETCKYFYAYQLLHAHSTWCRVKYTFFLFIRTSEIFFDAGISLTFSRFQSQMSLACPFTINKYLNVI